MSRVRCYDSLVLLQYLLRLDIQNQAKEFSRSGNGDKSLVGPDV